MISETVVMMRRAPKPRAIEGSENIWSKETSAHGDAMNLRLESSIKISARRGKFRICGKT